MLCGLVGSKAPIREGGDDDALTLLKRASRFICNPPIQ
jgi:hypothetical protein